jgi:4-alpha-glucanotransferase
MKLERASGVLLHPTSLSGPGEIGTVGAAARRFVDWLANSGQSYWQLLPLVAVDDGGSPYNALSAMAGNPLLIDLDDLAEEGLITRDEALGAREATPRVDFRRAAERHRTALAHAFRRFRAGAAPHLEDLFEVYVARNAAWLEDYTLFRALRERHGEAPWTRWDPELRDRVPAALEHAAAELGDEVGMHGFAQFLFDRQWAALREHARGRGIHIIGDVPVFVAHDSADVWSNQELFELDDAGEPRVVSGVPPDYFSETGQRWGNPLYDWDRLRERRYDWWIRRFRRTLEWVDLVRIDHFRGFESFWEIPAEESTAVRGRWKKGPGREIFDVLREELGDVPVIAEDLGLITPEVEALRDELGLPGMRVLQFAFDGDPENPHLPENYPANVVGYTGTHDNDTTMGWWRSAPEEVRRRADERVDGSEDQLHWQLMELVFQSAAVLVIVPVQDVLGLGADSRMNVPGTSGSNWSWRLPPARLTPAVGKRLREMTIASARATGAEDLLGDPDPQGQP